ncbi:ABC transporter permease [Haloarcula sp. GH36]|uniref:ABC transporter permease n=1 Tax=Haloarcula montana TaxID=3111776 RepID=UPI002D770C6B|nr:ABC transporter permease [Haloarcula sp. GH36]
MLGNTGLLVEQLLEHMDIAFTSIGIGTFLWVPLGVAIYHYDRFSTPVIGVAGMILTLPSLVLFPLLIPIVGIGTTPAIVALVLYAALPITRNTYTGLKEVGTAVERAGEGLGMTERQLLVRVKLPMAVPVIFAGIRQAAVLIIGITTIAAFFGAGGLGASIFAGIRLNLPKQIVGATLVVSVFAILTDYGLGLIQRRIPGGKRGLNA